MHMPKTEFTRQNQHSTRRQRSLAEKFLGRPWSVAGILGLVLTAAIFFSVPAVQADVPSPSGPGQGKEAVLHKAKAVLDNQLATNSDLSKVITTLKSGMAEFPREIRFPLYLAQAYYRVADPSKDIDQEFPIYAKVGKYAEQALKMDSKRPEGHYWYGLYLLRKAQKMGGIRAYFVTRHGIKELEEVRNTLPTYDHAGASRVLGLLYCLAPGWTPFGDLDKSIKLEEEATRLAPNHALNRLYLANAYKKQGDKTAAIREYRKLLAISSKLPGQYGRDFCQTARNKLQSLGASSQSNRQVALD